MFLSIKAQGDSGDRSPYGSFWFEPVPFRGGAGNITGDAAMQLTAVYACVRVLAESVSTLPFCIYRENANGGKDKITDHWLYRLFAKRPNAWQNPMEFREMMQGHLALRGNAFAQIVGSSNGEVTDLIPVHPDRVAIEMLNDSNWRYRISNRDQSVTVLGRGEMWHLKGLSGDGIVGYNPIQAARKAIMTGLAAQDYGMRYFINDAKPGGWIEYPGQFKDDEQRRQFRERWQSMQTGENRGKVSVLEFGMKFHEVAVSNEDSQFIETRKFSRSEIASLFRIPPHMIGDLEKATYSNIEQQSLEFVIHTLTPWLVRWEEAIEYAFLDEEDGLDVEFPVTSLLRGDAGARSKYYHAGILDGWMTRNEARLQENLNPLDGLDEPLRPLNMVEEDEIDPDEAGDDKPLQQLPTPALPAPAEPDSRLLMLARAAAERIARKEIDMVQRAFGQKKTMAEAYEKHPTFVAAALGISPDAAQAYCADQIAIADQQMEVCEFETLIICRLERLALKGTL